MPIVLLVLSAILLPLYLALPMPPITEEERHYAYKAYAEYYLKDEVVQVSQIVFSTSARAREMRPTLTLANFSEIAKKYSIDVTKDDGGYLGEWTRHQLDREFYPGFADIAFSKPAGISDMMILPDDKTIVFLFEVTKPDSAPTYEESIEDVDEIIDIYRDGKRWTSWLPFMERLRALK